MFMAAAKALAAASPARNNPKNNLLPPVTSLREVSVTVALAVALQAQKEGLSSGIRTDEIEALIRAKVWKPHYVAYSRIKNAAVSFGEKREKSNG
jgi:malate dehydrogenase (oxaloacetate-decarboxylating)